MKPWVIYTRVSTSKQAERGASLEAQLSACTALATAHGHQFIHVADEGESAKDVAQPGLMRIRQMANRGEIAGVMVYKLDRIARHTRGLLDLLEDFTRQGVQFTSLREHIDTSGAAGRLIVTVLAALAQFEREQLVERVKATNEHRRAQGAWVAGAAPIGLTTELRGKLRFLIPHPQWGTAIAEAWPLVIAGKPLVEIAATFQRAGVPTSTAHRKTSGVWARNAVSALLANRAYVGLLVTPDDFERARIILGSRPSPKNQKPTLPRPGASDRTWRLQGLAVCASCDSALTGKVAYGRGGHPYHHLRCTGRIQRGHAFCSAKDLPATIWEDRVVEKVAHYLRDRMRVLEAIQAEIAKRQAEAGPAMDRVRVLRDQQEETRGRLDRALELALQGGATARAVAPRLAALQATLETVERDLATAEAALAGVEIPRVSLEATAALLASTAEDLPGRPWDEQRDVLVGMRAQARLGVGKPCQVTIHIPYLKRRGEPGSPKAKEKLPSPDGGEPGSPAARVVVDLGEAPKAVRRWYRRPLDGGGMLPQ